MTEKRKLLIATDNFLPRWDGIARFLSEVIPRLVEQYEITVVAPDFGEYTDDRITLIKIPIFKKLKFGDFSPAKIRYGTMRKAVKNADVVFTQTIGPIGTLAIFIAKRMHKPIASFIHSIETELVPDALHGILKKYSYPFMRKFTRMLYSKSDLLIVPAESVTDMLGWNKIDTRTEVVQLGTDHTKFVPCPDKKAAKKYLEYAPDDMVIGYHGRISREKDLITLFRAFIRLQSKYPQIKLLILGDGIEHIKKKIALRHGVRVIPGQSNVLPFLHAMDIYVLPSLTETTSLSTLEAMSCSLPVVATRVGYVKDYIMNGINGLLFDKKNVYYLTKQLERLLTDEQLRKKLGQHARKTVIQQFDWTDTAKKIEILLHNLS